MDIRSELKRLKCIECKQRRKIISLNICRACYYKLYRRYKYKRRIYYNMNDYPL